MQSNKKYIEYIKDKLPSRDILEGLAEESAELSQAALKMIRASRQSKNYTPVTMSQAEDMLDEELKDVFMYAYLYVTMTKRAHPIPPESPKWERWAKRLGYKE